MNRPLIGITCDNKDNTVESRRYESNIAYSQAVTLAGGLPVILPQEPELAGEYVRVCAGILLTGGADPRTEAFGQPTHPQTRLVDPLRQAFDLAVLAALDRLRAKPALGVCLGMQFMALHAGGKMNQHLPDTLGDKALAHQKNNRHAVVPVVTDSPLLFTKLEIRNQSATPAASAVKSDVSPVASWHHQAVSDPGKLRLVATAPDGVIEAIDDPSRPFYLGVQWHPERGGEGPFNRDLLERFVNACRSARG